MLIGFGVLASCRRGLYCWSCRHRSCVWKCVSTLFHIKKTD